MELVYKLKMAGRIIGIGLMVVAALLILGSIILTVVPSLGLAILGALMLPAAVAVGIPGGILLWLSGFFKIEEASGSENEIGT